MKKYILKNVKTLSVWMLFEISFAGLMVIWSLITSEALDAGMKSEFRELGKILLRGVVFFAAMIASFYLQTLFYAKFINRCTYDLKSDLFKSVIEADANKYTEYNCAKYLSIFNNDVSMIVRDFFAGVPAIFAQLFLALVATITLFCYNPYLAICEIVLSLITSVVPILVNRNSAQLQKGYSEALGKYNTQIKDYITAGDVLKSYHVEDKIQEVHAKINQQVQDAYLKVEKNRGIVYAVITATRYLESALFLVFGAYLIASGHLAVATMLGALQIVGYVANPIKQATSLYTNYKRTKLVVEGVHNFLRSVKETEENKEELIASIPIRLDHIKFSYGEKSVLKDVNVCFDKGKKYAIIGESGSGKSTLIKIIMQQLTNYEGELRIGEQNSRNIDRESFVKHFALIQQEVILLEDSLRNNITMYGKFSEEEIMSAVCAAGLKKYVEGLPEGLDTMIGENGMNCSGGERQRITIARALLRKTSVLVMDEATSSLDADTAEQVESLLLNNPLLTVISITHKLETTSLKKYDEVYRMEDGKLKRV